MKIYIHRNNQQLGPFTEAEVRAQLASGAISPQDHVWWEGQSGWVPLNQSQFAATAVPPATPGQPPLPVPTGGIPGTPSSTASAKPTSQLAIWSLVCGCASLLCMITSIPAIILGHMGLSEIKKNPAMQGRGMALAGLIIGYVIAALFIVYLGVVGISVLIALGNQVKTTSNTIDSQLHSTENQTPSTDTNSPDMTTNNADTNAPDTSTNAPSTNSPDMNTNAPDTNSPDMTTNAPDTNSPDASTNAAPANQ